jgi:hypothetical protein
MDSTGSNSRETPANAPRLVVCLSTFNQAGTIGGVVHALVRGLDASPDGAAIPILLADSGSTDGTLEAATRAGGERIVEVPCPRHMPIATMPYHGQPGRAAALRALLEAACQRKASACAFVDGSLKAIAPDRVDRLVGPVIGQNVDYVTPFYSRHPFDGPITNAIVAPVFRALYGVALRQPAVGEFGCSTRLAEHLLEEGWWDRDGAAASVDLWVASAAVCGGFRVCEAPLGVRVAAPPEARADLSTTLAQVVGGLFADLDERVDDWQRVRGATAPAVCGDMLSGESEPPSINVERLVDSFRLGYKELREIWTWVLPPRTLIELRKLSASPIDQFRFDDELWAGIIYDFAFGYSFHVMPRDHLLRSLVPLYSGWMASYVVESQGTPQGALARLDQVALAFETQKRHLISRWRWPEKIRR